MIRYCTDAGEVSARAKVIVNAGGAWIDQINRQLGITSQLIGEAEARIWQSTTLTFWQRWQGG